MSAVFVSAFLIIELYKSGANLHVKKIVELLHCNNFNMENIRGSLESVTLCSELMRITTSGFVENQGFITEKRKMKEGWHEGCFPMKRQKCAVVLKM